MEQVETDSATPANHASLPPMHTEALASADAGQQQSIRVDSAVEPVDELPTPTQSPLKAKPAFDIVTSNFDNPSDEEFTSSPNVETPTDPTTPTTPQTPTHDLSRDSMTSVALSESSLDYDHLAPEQVEDVIETPRVSGARRHLRKVSSLDIMHNQWTQHGRQSAFFDSAEEKQPTPMSAVEFPQDRDVWTPVEGSELSDNERRLSNGTIHTVDFLEPPTAGISEASWRRSDGSSSEEESQVDWQALDKTEEQEKEDKSVPEGAEDESTAFLLARLEQENAKFATDPKAASGKTGARARAVSRPPSMAQLKKLVTLQDQHGPPSIRFSMASDNGIPNEIPPMTELEFWAALVQDYPTTATRLPTLTATKIRAGVPPPLRGVVWVSMSGARDRDLEDAYDTLLHEKSPYEGIINKDVGRSFPGVELFRDAEGEGQKMLGRVLKCFSLHDKDIGYCQGLGFLVGPLLMNMGEKEAFCVLVRLMDHFSLRPSFLPSLSGLHMRIYQFSALLKQHHPKLHEHLAHLGIEPAYLSQWFLSCFAVTCPLPMLFRIYDVIFAEGANETVMRVAIALMRRHEEMMLATVEFEEIMQLLLGREMWDCYGGDADELVDDFTSLGDIVTNARLSELEKDFERQSSEAIGQSAGFLPDVQAAASRFLGRLWTPGYMQTPSKPVPANVPHTPSASVSTLSPPSTEKEIGFGAYSFFARPTSFLRRIPSKQSINANESSSSEDSASTHGSGSTALTEPDLHMRESMADSMSMRSKPDSLLPPHGRETQELHTQIEDLLVAIGDMQREHAQLVAMLQREREERSEDQKILRHLVEKLRKDHKEDRRKTMPVQPRGQKTLGVSTKSRPLSVGGRTDLQGEADQEAPKDEIQVLVEKAQDRLATNVRFSTCLETKAQLRSNLIRTREELAAAEAQSKDLTARLESAEASATTFQSESEDLRSEVKELRGRVADEFKARQKMEHNLGELKAQARSMQRKERMQRVESMHEGQAASRSESSSEASSRKGSTHSLPNGVSGGLRELKLGQRDSISSIHSLRSGSAPRNTTPPWMEGVPRILTAASESYSPIPEDVASPGEALDTPATPVSREALGASPPGLPVPRTGFARRTSSLATKEVIATPQHEPVPDEALLLELVNAKTSEAQAKQEVDELKKALAVGKRKQDEAIAQMRAELDNARAAAVKASESAVAARAETEALRMSQLSSGTGYPPSPAAEGGSSHGSTPADTPGEERISDMFVPKKASMPGGVASSVGGWFWQRRNASRSGITPTEE